MPIRGISQNSGRGSGLLRQRAVAGWAMYDWANSGFALTVMTSFVPVMLAGYWNDGAPSSVGTFRLGLANGIASLIAALLVPMLGAMADSSGRRKVWLLWLTCFGVVMTAGLYLVQGGMWLTALVLFVLASIAFSASNALYDSLLVDVTAPVFFDRVSAYGYGLGYLGGALLLTLNVLMVAFPGSFGLASPDAALRAAFLLVGCWWLLFSVPLALWVRDDPLREGGPGVIVNGFRQVIITLRAARAHPALYRFLIAYWLYIDGVYTIIKMAVDYGLSIGLTSQDLIQAVLLTNFIGFPAALGFGYLAQFIGTRAGIFAGLGVYVLATLVAPFISTPLHFYLLAATVGLVQGGVQSLSRSFFARLIPPGQSAEYFGFYNMLGKFAAILGPVMAGVATLLTGNQRFGILSLLVLFVAGSWLLTGVRVQAGGGSP